MTIPEFIKPPWAILDYYVDWTVEFVQRGILIASSFWVLPSANPDSSSNFFIALSDAVTPNYDAENPIPRFNLGGTNNDSYRAMIMISGGTNGNSYLVQNYVIPTGSIPRRYSKQFRITVRD